MRGQGGKVLSGREDGEHVGLDSAREMEKTIERGARGLRVIQSDYHVPCQHPFCIKVGENEFACLEPGCGQHFRITEEEVIELYEGRGPYLVRKLVHVKTG